jgi:hypothetical protein
MQNDEPAVRLSIHCCVAPGGNAVAPALPGGRLAIRVEHLPRQRAAFLPAGAFGPDHQRLAASILASRRARISVLGVGCIQIHWRPARIGGNSPWLWSAGEAFRWGVRSRSGWAWKRWRMVENSGECYRFRHRKPRQRSILAPTFARPGRSKPNPSAPIHVSRRTLYIDGVCLLGHFIMCRLTLVACSYSYMET